MRELDKILNKKEKVLWEGRPKFWPFIFSRSTLITVVGFFWLLFIFPILLMGAGLGGFGFLWWIVILPFFLIGVVLTLGMPIYNILLYSNLYYAITDKRVIIQTGVVGRDFDITDFDQISNAEVDVGFFDVFFRKNTGSIKISTAGTYTSGEHGIVPSPYLLSNVPNPYKVFKFFKEVSHDVKTDIYYPNKYRPKVNPGYGTKYRPRQSIRRRKK